LLTLHPSPQVFILVKARYSASGTSIVKSEIATFIPVIMEELRFKRYWLAVSTWLLVDYCDFRVLDQHTKLKILTAFCPICSGPCPEVLVNLLVGINTTPTLLAIASHAKLDCQ